MSWAGATLGPWQSEVDGADVNQPRRWLDHDQIDRVVNVASPNPLPNAEFMRHPAGGYGVPFALPAQRWMLEIGAIFIRTETELILKSRRVCSNTASRSGCRTGLMPRATCAASGTWPPPRVAQSASGSRRAQLPVATRSVLD